MIQSKLRLAKCLALALVPQSLLSLAASAAPLPAKPANATQSAPQPNSGNLSPAQYRDKLQSLDQLVLTCRHAMTPANCQSEQVGSDLKVALPSGSRQVRLAWLRELLTHAATGELPSKATGKKPESILPDSAPPDFTPPALAQQLEDAHQRLAAEAQSAAKLSASAQSSQSAGSTPLRQSLTQILAAKEYHAAVARPSLLHRALEKVDNWLARLFANLRKAGFQSRWIGLAAEIGFGLLVCVALAWFLIRLERRGRLGAAAFHPELAAGAPSARDWQLWLDDAQKAAAKSAWRDAIHYLYWASISRLESSGLWPADRARTPREYLALLSRKSAERTDLAALTRSFERTWYAGRPADELDFREAAQMAAELGTRIASPPPPQSPLLKSPEAQ